MFEAILDILLFPITERLDKLMATVEELAQQVADTKASLQAAIERVQADVDNLKAQTGGINPADLDPISQGLADLKTSLDSLDPDPSFPPTA